MEIRRKRGKIEPTGNNLLQRKNVVQSIESIALNKIGWGGEKEPKIL